MWWTTDGVGQAALLVRGEDTFHFLDRIYNVVFGIGDIWDISLPDIRGLQDYIEPYHYYYFHFCKNGMVFGMGFSAICRKGLQMGWPGGLYWIGV